MLDFSQRTVKLPTPKTALKANQTLAHRHFQKKNRIVAIYEQNHYLYDELMVLVFCY